MLFTSEEIGVQRGEEPCPRSHSWKVRVEIQIHVSPNLEPSPSAATLLSSRKFEDLVCHRCWECKMA